MPLETKFLRLRTPVTIGSRFGDWEVSWLGGWTRNRLCYLVMVVRVPLCAEPTNSRGRWIAPGFAFSLTILSGHYGGLRVFRPTTLQGEPSIRFPQRITCAVRLVPEMNRVEGW